jgi:hypothetical protein
MSLVLICSVSVRLVHAFARYFDMAAEMLSACSDDPDFGTNLEWCIGALAALAQNYALAQN